MKYRYIYFFIFFVLLSCESNFSQEISDLILEKMPLSFPIQNVVILADSDCFSCFEEVLNSLEPKKSIGLYFSSSPDEFERSLTELNPEIKWMKLKGTKLLHLISNKDDGFKGPYRYKYIKDIYVEQPL